MYTLKGIPGCCVENSLQGDKGISRETRKEATQHSKKEIVMAQTGLEAVRLWIDFKCSIHNLLLGYIWSRKRGIEDN